MDIFPKLMKSNAVTRQSCDFFHRQGFALKVPQPWSDRQDEEQREIFRKNLKELLEQPDVDIWFADESGLKVIRVPDAAGIEREAKPESLKTETIFA